MTAKKRTGGRVTPKGTQPPAVAAKRERERDQAESSGPPRAVPGRVDPGHGRPSGGPTGPTRAGPRGGNR
jgi:hypothetical protein